MTKLTKTGERSWYLEGDLTFKTVPKVLPECPEVDATETVIVDLSGLRLGDSAGLSLLVEWMAIARKNGGVIRYIKLPPNLKRLAQVLGLDCFKSANEWSVGDNGD